MHKQSSCEITIDTQMKTTLQVDVEIVVARNDF